MCHVFLPIEHSDDDLALAGQVAECLESRSLYVTWSPDGYRRPDLETLWQPGEDPEADPRRPGRAPGVWAEAVGTVVAFIAGLRRPRPRAV